MTPCLFVIDYTIRISICQFCLYALAAMRPTSGNYSWFFGLTAFYAQVYPGIPEIISKCLQFPTVNGQTVNYRRLRQAMKIGFFPISFARLCAEHRTISRCSGILYGIFTIKTKSLQLLYNCIGRKSKTHNRRLAKLNLQTSAQLHRPKEWNWGKITKAKCGMSLRVWGRALYLLAEFPKVAILDG